MRIYVYDISVRSLSLLLSALFHQDKASKTQSKLTWQVCLSTCPRRFMSLPSEHWNYGRATMSSWHLRGCWDPNWSRHTCHASAFTAKPPSHAIFVLLWLSQSFILWLRPQTRGWLFYLSHQNVRAQVQTTASSESFLENVTILTLFYIFEWGNRKQGWVK